MLTLLLTLLAAEATPPKPPPPPPQAAVSTEALAPFSEMTLALETRDIPRYQAAWHPVGWSRNLVGPDGLSGEAAAGQAKSEGWNLRPDPGTLAKHEEGEAWVVRCDVVLPDGKVVDAVFAAIGRHEGAHVVVGAGENLGRVNALAGRIARGERLAPAPPPPAAPPRGGGSR
ncbi:MAG: hypothetical protein KC912_25625 [Proteobacteria bacterium]|nr:hypothetical protein [Pseudomonadota bacterium]